jgi:predicted esterase YcpF (UPF0227 family)
MKILYVHGFGSHYDPEHEKIKLLETLGTVVGVDVDYCKGFRRAFEMVLESALSQKVDLIVGTSMGGFMAAHVGAETGTPFVALNPATQPSKTLQKWVGTFTDYAGNDRTLTKDCVDNYPDIIQEGSGLVIVETADEIINAYNTAALLNGVYQVEVFGGGSHRFTHMKNALPVIQEFYTQSETSYGSDEGA